MLVSYSIDDDDDDESELQNHLLGCVRLQLLFRTRKERVHATRLLKLLST